MKSVFRSFAMLVALAFAFVAFGAAAQDARAQAAEPSLAQIYEAANSGKMDRADAMLDQVLKSHPNSAKAHYVKAELLARERKFDLSREQLAAAEKIAPGLPFAKAESVQALRNQLSNASTSANTPARTGDNGSAARTRQMGAPSGSGDTAAAQPAQRGFPWGTLAIVAAVVLIGMAVLRRRTAAMNNAGVVGNGGAAAYGQTGNGPMYPPGGVQPGMQPYGPGQQPGYGPGYGQGYPAQPSMGSSIARGVGTGLAIGAGAVAAQEIGRRMFDHGGQSNAAGLDHNTGNTPSLDQIDDGMRRNLNTDMGGNDFGIADGGWDDAGGGGGGDAGGGGDWDT